MNTNEKLNQPLDYSKLTPIELKALSVMYENSITKGTNPPFPYFHSALESLGEQFLEYPAEEVGALKIFHDELIVIRRHLWGMAPIPPAEDPEEVAKILAPGAILDNLLKSYVVRALDSAFSIVQDMIETRIDMVEKGVTMGNGNETIN